MGDFNKRISIVTHIESLKADLICLVDTRLSDIKSRMLENEADSFKWFFTNGIAANNSISRGISVGIRKSSMILPGESQVIIPGNLLKVSFKFEGHEFAFFGVYGPSDNDNPNFFESLFNECSTSLEKFKVMAGDFNVPLNFRLDTHNCSIDSRRQARTRILDKMEDHRIKDAYRSLHGNRELYTWHNPGGTKRSRLDYFLVSESLLPVVKKAGKGIFFRSDHRSVDIRIDFSGIKAGKKRWRYTPNMRQDQALKASISNEIYESLFRYVDLRLDNYDARRNLFFNTNPTDLFDFDYSISWGDLLNVTLNDVRNVIISYETGKRLIKRNELTDIQNEILRLEEEPTPDFDRLTLLTDRYDELINTQTINRLTNRQDAFKVDGERPTSFFLNLEKNIISENYIPRLREGDRWITDQDTIETKIRDFYKDLYKEREDLRTGINIEEYIGPEGVDIAPKLTAANADSIEGEISKEEIWAVLIKTKEKSAPGLTGFTYSFFKDFWPFFGNLLTNTFNEAFIKGKIPDFMSRGVISLLPKGSKDRAFLKNWRPITLLECAYKLLSGCLAARLNSVINVLVDPVQKGFVPDRNIAENTRTFYDILDYAKKEKKGGTAIVLDYEKAFDTLSHRYFREVLYFFGFGEKFIKWIDICLANFYASTSHADNISENFLVGRGARQGDPLSPPIFALAIEIFSLKIRSSPEAIPFKMGNQFIKLLLYADDSIIITTQDEDSVRFILNAVGDFFGLSGLKIQLQKCNIFNFGIEGPDLCTDIEIERSERIMYLGIQFDRFLRFMDENITKKMEEIIEAGKKWFYRFLTPLGRSVIAKSLLIPKICHILSCVKVSPKVISKFQQKIFEFIWGGEKKRAAFARDDAQVSSYEGGLNMPDLAASLKSFQISWLRRAAKNQENNVWRNWLDELLQKACGLPFDQLMLAGNRQWQLAANKVENTFWKEVFKSYNRMVTIMVENDPSKTLSMTIWDSTFFRANNRFLSSKIRRFENIVSKISTPHDLLGQDGKILSHEAANAKIGIFVPVDILLAINQRIEQINRTDIPRILPNAHQPLFVPFNYACLTKFSKGCSYWNRFLRRRKTANIRYMEDKTANLLGIHIDQDRWKQVYWTVSNIKYGNELKWLVYQILRGCLTTNTVLKKMKQRNCDLCTFCRQAPETTGHLFWDCREVSQFLKDIKDRLEVLCPGYDLGFTLGNHYGKEIFLLGDNRPLSGLAPNYLYNVVKKFIWNVRCKEEDLSTVAFFRFLSFRLKVDKALQRKFRELSYIGDLADRHGIG